MPLVPLVLLLAAASDGLRLTIVHNNDMHSRFEQTSRTSGTCGSEPDCVGGFARTAHRVREYRREGGARVLYLNAGDTYVGTSWFSVHKWRICADFMEALKPDVMCLGNHEFDFGVKELAPFVDNVTFPIVAANLDLSLEPSLSRVKRSVVLEIEGTKVGVVGHLTPDTALMSSPGRVKFLDVVSAVRAETEKLDAAGVKVIIVLGHSGYETDRRVAAEVPLADVVVGGHTNTFLWNGPAPDLERPEAAYPAVVVQRGGKRVPVVQAYAYTKYLGVLNVTFDARGDLVHFAGQPELLDAAVPQDRDLLDLLGRYRREIDELDRKVVGRARVLLDAGPCRLRECNQGNLIADALVYYVAAQHAGPGWTGAPVALLNGGGIRTTIDPPARGGNITRGELLGTLPFGNRVLRTRMTGRQLVASLEIGARSDGETSRGEFLQVSGLRVVYDRSRPSLRRVVSVKARCGDCRVPRYEDLVEDRVYEVITVTFLAQGGDGHTAIKEAVDAYSKAEDLGDVEVVEWYLERQSPVYPEEQGRIRFVNGTESQQHSSGSGRRRAVGPAALVVAAIGHLFTFFRVR